MPIIPLQSSEVNQGYLGVVTNVNFSPAYTAETGKINHQKITRPLYRVPKFAPFLLWCIFIAMVILFVACVLFNGKPFEIEVQRGEMERALRSSSMEDKGAYIAFFIFSMLFLLIKLLLFIGKATITKTISRPETASYSAKMDFVFADFQNPPAFDQMPLSINWKPDDKFLSTLKNGQVLCIYCKSNQIVFISNLNTGQLIDKNHTPYLRFLDMSNPLALAHTPHNQDIQRVYTAAYTLTNSPLKKPDITFSGPGCSINYNSTGADLGFAYHPWTKYFIGVAAVMEVRRSSTPRPYEISYADFGVYEFEKPFMNPLAVQRVQSETLGSLRDGNIVIALMQSENIGVILDLKTGFTYDISKNSGCELPASKLILLDEEKRRAAYARLHLDPIAKKQARKMIYGEIQRDPHV